MVSRVTDWLGLTEASKAPRLDPDIFASHYCGAVSQLLPAGTQAPTSVRQAFELSQQLLPPLTGTRLAGIVSQALTTVEDDLRAAVQTPMQRHPADPSLTREIEESAKRAGKPYPSRVYLQGITEPRNAKARFGEVCLGTWLLKPENIPLRHFIVGHEISHNVSRDSAASLGYIALEEQVKDSPLSDQLQRDLSALSHEDELRSDKDGFEFALAQDVAAEDLLRRLSEHFRDPVSKSHPSGQARVEALRREFAPRLPSD